MPQYDDVAELGVVEGGELDAGSEVGSEPYEVSMERECAEAIALQ